MSGRSFLKLMISAAFLFGVSPALAESRMALVIGQSAYKSVPALPNPANDAKAMTQLLTESGFEVLSASDLSQNELRGKVSDFANQVAAKGADTVALVFYAGHGLQIDGENYLVPVDVDPKREADIPIQAVRLNDVLNTLNSVPSRMRILLLDACRNNPFPDLNKTAGHGLAIVDTKSGAPGTFVSFSTSPGAEAEDGNGANSPYTTALLTAAREPAAIEDTLKRVRVAVNKATDGRQTPWDSSSLTEDFRFAVGSGPMAAAPRLASTKRTVEEWKQQLQGQPVEAANEIIVADGSDEAYEAFATLYASTPRGLQARDWLDRHRRMVAWNNAVLINTTASYRTFLTQYPDTDLTVTARKLEERLRNRPNMAVAVATPVSLPVTNAALTCPCNNEPAPQPLKRVETPMPSKKVEPPPSRKVDTPTRKRVVTETPKRGSAPPRRVIEEEEVVVYRRPPPPPPVSIGIGIGLGTLGGLGGGGRGGHDSGGHYQRDGGSYQRGGY